MLCYMPTLALTNSLSFHQMRDPGKEFPRVRVSGTIGWIAAGYVISYLGASSIALQFRIAAAAAAALGLLRSRCRTPRRPSSDKGVRRDVLGLDALQLMRERSFTCS